MKAIPLAIPDVVLIEPMVFGDERGFFFESFNQRDFNQATGLNQTFVQDNHSKSRKGVLRGLHYQTRHAQGKLVRVTQGAVFDVAVDIRKDSPTFGKWFGLELSAENKKQLWIPAGLAHGFLVTRAQSFCTKQPTITIQNLKPACYGTMRRWASTGRCNFWMRPRYWPPKIWPVMRLRRFNATAPSTPSTPIVPSH